MWVTLGSDAILAVRTYAFLLRDKKVIIALGVLLTGECAYLLYVSIAGVFQVPILIGTEGPCTASDFPGKHVGTFALPFRWSICMIFTLKYSLGILACSCSIQPYLHGTDAGEGTLLRAPLELPVN